MQRVHLLTLIVLVALLCGCGGPVGQPTPVVGVDPVLRPYFDSFLTDALKYTGRPLSVTDLILIFSDGLGRSLLGEVVGECDMKNSGQDGTPKAQIDRQYFDSSSEQDRKDVVYHELGHCVLFREHRNDWLSIFGPDLVLHYIAASIMDQVTINVDDAEMFWDYYGDELFNGY